MDGLWIYTCVYPMLWRWECIVNLDTLYTSVSRTITREQQMRMLMVGVVWLQGRWYPCQPTCDSISIDMRKPLPRDTKRETVRDNGEKVLVHPEELEPWR